MAAISGANPIVLVTLITTGEYLKSRTPLLAAAGGLMEELRLTQHSSVPNTR